MPSVFVGQQGRQCSRMEVSTDHKEPCRSLKDLAFCSKVRWEATVFVEQRRDLM